MCNFKALNHAIVKSLGSLNVAVAGLCLAAGELSDDLARSSSFSSSKN